jgi:hypothetical protein
MSVLFKPNGTLNVAIDPCDLPETTDGKGMIISYAIARCKNLRLDQDGKAVTRDGSTKLNSTAVSGVIREIIEQNGYRYTFAGTTIYRNEILISSVITNASWSAMLYNSFNDTTEQVFATNGTDRKRIEGITVYEWGISAPTSVPVIAAGALTGLSGAYNVKYTYCRKVGTTVVCESNPSDAAAAAVTLANQSLSITWTASTDSQVTHVRIYRTLVGGGTYYLDQDIAIGTTTVDSNTADGALGSEAPTDHDRPPLNGTCLAGPNFNGTCFMLVGNKLYFCKPKQPEYWPVEYFLELGPVQHACQSIVFYGGIPYVLTKHEIHAIQGTGADSFFPYRENALTGCHNVLGAWSIKGKGIFHAGTDGIYLFDGSQDRKISQAAFDPIFRGEDAGGMPGMSDHTKTWIIANKNKIYIGYASSGNTYSTNLIVFNLDNDRVTYYEYSQEIVTVSVDLYNNRLLAGDSSGYVWVLDDIAATTDSGTAIEWELQSKDFMLQTRSHFPRFCKYDVDAGDAVTATGSLILDGDVHQIHTLSDSRNVKKRLVDTGNGQRMALRISGSGSVSIYAVEAE